MAWRLARSLEKLRAQINARHPERSKVSDGTIGDQAHQATASDHNPNSAGVVTAMDITHDPAHGVDTWRLAEVLRQNKDPRIKYVISNGRIFSSSVSPWQWRKYTGANAHAHHVHISVGIDYDNTAEWKLDGGATTVTPVVKPPSGITPDMRRRMGRKILEYEARFVDGKIAVYYLPANDGGGTYEVAGINDKYHPEKAARLKSLIEQGKHKQAEDEAIDYYLDYSKPAAGWTTYAGPEFILRSTVVNRGPTGAARILQRAVMVHDDGEVGPVTRSAMEKYSPDDLISKLRWAREDYERSVVGYRENFWKGLVSRWNKEAADGRAFQKEQGAVSVTLPVSVGAGTFALFSWLGAHPLFAGLIALATIAAFVGIIKLMRKD